MKKLTLLLLAACWRGPEVGEEQMQMLSPDGGRIMTFHEIETEVFETSCATSFCHKPDPPPAAPMTLEPGKAYVEIVSVPASQKPMLKRIAPGDPASSYIIIKMRAVTAQAHGTTRMPLNKPEVSEDLIQQVEAWVARGAPND
jgi:hypothetical protein